MTLPVPVANKVGKLIPLLGSDKDGEVLGAARAIKRTLQSAGRDLHDLAARLAAKSSRPEPRSDSSRPASSPLRWRSLSVGERIIMLDGMTGLALSPWEREFVASISNRLRYSPCASLSQRQVQVLDGLLRRLEDEQ